MPIRLPFISLLAAGALALGGCAYGDLGYGAGYGYGGYYGSYYGGGPYYGPVTDTIRSAGTTTITTPVPASTSTTLTATGTCGMTVSGRYWTNQQTQYRSHTGRTWNGENWNGFSHRSATTEQPQQ